MKKSHFFFERLHPAYLAFYLLSEIFLTVFCAHPLFHCVSLASSFLLCLILDGKKTGASLRFYVPFFILIAITNPFFSHEGDTPFLFVNGQPWTVESVFYGIDMATMLCAVLFWCRVWNEIMTTDKLTYLFGSKLPKIGLILSSSLRLIPLMKRKWSSIRETQKLLLPPEKGFFDRIKRFSDEFSALTTYALENAVETGMCMAAKGYGLPGKTNYSFFDKRKEDYFFFSLSLLFLIGSVCGMVFGQVDFAFYPTMTPVESGRGTTGVLVWFALQSLFIPCMEMKENIKWYFLSKM